MYIYSYVCTYIMHTYIPLYTYTIFYYTYIHAVCILCIHKHKKRLYRNHKTNPLVTQCALWHCTKQPAYTYILKISCYEPLRFNMGSMWVRQGVAPFLAGWSAFLSSMFWKFLVRASRFVVRAEHPPAPPVATGLAPELNSAFWIWTSCSCRDSTDGSSRAQYLVIPGCW